MPRFGLGFNQLVTVSLKSPLRPRGVLDSVIVYYVPESAVGKQHQTVPTPVLKPNGLPLQPTAILRRAVGGAARPRNSVRQQMTDEHVVYSRPNINRDGLCRFNAVDGSTTKNQPFELARVELVGLKHRNPRRGQDAHLAVIMVDPFPDPQADLPEPQYPLWDTFYVLLTAFKAQSCFI